MGSLWSLIRLGIGALTSKDGQADAIRSTPGPIGSTAGQEQAARYYPWGYDSRSPAGGKRLCVAPSGGSNLVAIGERNDSAKPDYDDPDWTAILHNESTGTWIKLRSDGGVQIQGNGLAKGLIEIKADGSIQLNGNAVAVIKSGDGVTPTADMLAWMNSVGGFCGFPPPPTLAAKIGTSQSSSTKVVTGL